MNYKKFTIANYRAITGPLEIEVEKISLMPIIGVNESGKTTILQAIFAFDYVNDHLNNSRHLKDVANLYGGAPLPTVITAEISSSATEMGDLLDEILDDDPGTAKSVEYYKRKLGEIPQTFSMLRRLPEGTYEFMEDGFSLGEFNDRFAREMVRRYLPYILYFDDFRDSVDERVEILETEDKGKSGWLDIIEQLFIQTDPNLSVSNCPAWRKGGERAHSPRLTNI